MDVATTVMKRGEPRFNMVGQFLGYPLKTLDEAISAGLAQRLARYAEKRMADAGFTPLLSVSSTEVYTMDGEDTPSNRTYCVKFQNAKGGFVEIVGIHTSSGWPFLDHGFAIGED